MALNILRRSPVRPGFEAVIAFRGMTKTKKPGVKKNEGEQAYTSERDLYEKLLHHLQPSPRPQPTLTPEQKDERALIAKNWTRYCMRKHKQELKERNMRLAVRDQALLELQRINENLYSQAMVPDLTPFPLNRHPPGDTPPTRIL